MNDLITSGYGCLSTDQNNFVAKNPEKNLKEGAI
jgi:hypothetical protein